jgi:hypothetical protein
MTPRPSVLALAMTGVLTAAVLAAQSPQQSTQTAQPTAPTPQQTAQTLQQTAQTPDQQDALTERAMTADLRHRQPGLGAAEVARIVRGFKVAPVRLDLAAKDPLLVGLGSYLVNTGGCNDCHTNPSFAAGGDPFQGQPKRVNAEHYLAGGAMFGPFLSRNLTPDPTSGLPAGLTYAQFAETIRTGIDIKKLHPEVSPLLQVMPWPVYQDLTDRDLRAIYEYLRAIPHAEPGAAGEP